MESERSKLVGAQPPEWSPRFVWTMCAANVVGAVAHGTGMGMTLAQGRFNIEMPLVKWMTENAGNSTHPRYVMRVRETSTIQPTSIVVAWFALSFSFHVVIATALAAHAFRGNLANWYFTGLYHGRAFWRWLEYFFSASIMMLITVRMLGQAEVYSIVASVGCMAITQLFGWFTELYSSLHIVTLPEEDPNAQRTCGYTLTRRWSRDRWTTVHRFCIHLGGYIPYTLSWYIVIASYQTNMDVIANSVPSYTHAMVWGSFAVFTMFGFVQLFNQLFPFGPSVYWAGELTYVVLSFAAKAQLGFLVLYQVLMPGSVFDEFLGIREVA